MPTAPQSVSILKEHAECHFHSLVYVDIMKSAPAIEDVFQPANAESTTPGT